MVSRKLSDADIGRWVTTKLRLLGLAQRLGAAMVSGQDGVHEAAENLNHSSDQGQIWKRVHEVIAEFVKHKWNLRVSLSLIIRISFASSSSSSSYFMAD